MHVTICRLLVAYKHTQNVESEALLTTDVAYLINPKEFVDKNICHKT